MKMKIGQRIHIDVDDEEYGRVASDATIEFVHEAYILVAVDSIRANILILPSEAKSIQTGETLK